MNTKKITTARLKKMKLDQEPISIITAYDYPSARLAEEAGIDVILVGDSLGNVVLGYESTLPVTIDDMVYHTKAVTRGAAQTFVISDMPFLTYHGDIDRALRLAGRLMQEGLCKAVKMEGGTEIIPVVQSFVHAGIPVMGHLGFTPQSVYQIGGYKVQGKNSEQADKMLKDALALEAAGAFAILLEMVTAELADYITHKLQIPTIGIGSGNGCDGQVLVFHDVLGYEVEAHPKKFVKKYADIGQQIKQGISQYVSEVKSKTFPNQEQTFHSDQEVISYLYGEKKS
ncbi:MAG: 3-methyl-2-oxobutanoate hydroxymethyltransferase [Paenibacillus sp. RIFOXYA1_FULL_44_5]|nr:MAG: 3-methyl-2-oxobutanoate hydroxymethyltransferase [Paenibacillus sp. RIFOXYA1_FULL_44_5]